MRRLMSRQTIMLPEDATDFGHLLKENFENVRFYRTMISATKQLAESPLIYQYDKSDRMLSWSIDWHDDDWKPTWQMMKQDNTMYRVRNELPVSALITYKNYASRGSNPFLDNFEFFMPQQATANYVPDDKNAIAIARKFIRLVEKGGSRWDVLVDMATLQPFGEPTKKDRPVSWPAARQSCIDHPQRFLGTQFLPEQQKTFGYKPVEWLEHLKR